MKTRGIRYLPPLAISVGLTVGCLLVNVPIAYFTAGTIASVLIIILAIRDVIK